jgi:hypothetical protein
VYKVGDKFKILRGSIYEITVLSIDNGWYRVIQVRREIEDGEVYTWEKSEVYRAFQLQELENRYLQEGSKLGQVLA